ncbi:MAG: ABC transporter ATP-binding protein [Saprospirales bacterium]|nr:ABC transporter ATP-binding protein [Saprospirales bacterium]
MTDPMMRLFRYLKRYRKQVTLATGASVTNKIFDLMPPFLTAWMIDAVSGNIPAWIGQWLGFSDAWSAALFIGVLTVVIFGLESFFEWLLTREFMRLAQRVQHDLRVDTYARVQERELAFFEDQRTGNLLSILNDDVNQLERFLNDSFNEIIQLLLLVVVATWSLCAVSLELGLLGILPLPFIIWGSVFYQRRIAPYYRDVRNAVGDLNNRLENNLSGILVIKSFAAEAFERKRVEEVSAAYRTANFKAIRWNALYVPLIRIFIALSFAGTLVLGAYWVITDPGRLSLGSLAFFAMMIQRLLWPVTRVGSLFDGYERAKAAARRIFGLLDTPPAITSPANPAAVPAEAGQISLEGVHFFYKEGQPVLRGLNLDIPSGTTIGIAGPTGAGKTTLIKLLLRLYDIQEGAIRLDGKDLRQLDLRDLRAHIALVSQDVYLFHGSIRENIAYGLEEKEDVEVAEAARRAQLHDFIAQLPDGYDSIIGERGIKLSGGQRQRLSIARAILKDAPILILDEATSSVDTETERAIQENLAQLTIGKTALMIAHRLSTIRYADKIVVLQEGKLVEEGTHKELLALDGLYADLWKVQTGELILK